MPRPRARADRCVPLGASLLALALLAACAQPAREPGAAPRPGEWRSFEGTWTAAGDRRSLEIDPQRQAAIVDLSGTILLTGERGLGVGF